MEAEPGTTKSQAPKELLELPCEHEQTSSLPRTPEVAQTEVAPDTEDIGSENPDILGDELVIVPLVSPQTPQPTTGT